MAANYWESTQRRHWQFTKDQLATMRQTLEETDPSLVLMYPLPSPRHLAIFFNQQISRLGKRLGVRQQAMATAQVYIKRFYTRVEIRRTNPYLVVATSVYLACKMEECPQHIRLMVTEARSLWPDFLSFTDTSKLGECEFFLISEMHSQLIVHQPYRTLATQQGELGLSTEEARMAWDIINDHYMTDLPLLYPPHIVALTAILLALVFRTGATPGVAASNMAAATAALTQAGSRMGPGGGGMGVGSEQQSQSQQQLQQQQQQLGKDAAAVAAGSGSPVAGGRAGKVHKLAQWLAESNVDIEAMIDCTQELIAFYECQEQYNDKDTREQINRFVKARSLNK